MFLAKVLLVDDEKAFVESLARRLTLREIQTICAFSGEQALLNLQEDRTVDVVILDMKMPGMDGLETIRAINERFPLVEVIMLTGHATIESAVEGMKLGAFDYLVKPCEIDGLIERIMKAAAQKRYYEKKLMEELIQPYCPKSNIQNLIRKIKEQNDAPE